MLETIDPEMDIAQAVSTSIYHAQTLSTATLTAGSFQGKRSVKIMELTPTQRILEWGRGECDTGDATIDNLAIYKNFREEYVDNDGMRRGKFGKLQTNRSP
jgi:hypothetical protein